MTKRHKNSLYFNIKEQLLKQIHTGIYNVGDKLPTESDLCELYNASRTTIRLALSELEIEGILERTQRKGTFVKRKELQLNQTRSFAQDLIMQGKEPINKLLEAKVIPSSSPFDEFFQISSNTPLNQLLRVRYADAEPVLYERTYIPWSLAPGLVNEYTEGSGSLFDFLGTRYGIKLHRSTEQLKPVLADKLASKLLQIKEGAPCLQVKTFTYSSDNTLIEYSFGIFRGDFSNYTIERFF